MSNSIMSYTVQVQLDEIYEYALSSSHILKLEVYTNGILSGNTSQIPLGYAPKSLYLLWSGPPTSIPLKLSVRRL